MTVPAKGRVERSIRYIRDNFFAARQWSDLEDLNAQAASWCRGASGQRPCAGDPQLTVKEAFEKERAQLLALPDNPFVAEEVHTLGVGKTPYVRFDRNDYSVPHTLVRRKLTVRVSPATVRVLDAGELVGMPVSTARANRSRIRRTCKPW